MSFLARIGRKRRRDRRALWAKNYARLRMLNAETRNDIWDEYATRLVMFEYRHVPAAEIMNQCLDDRGI